MKVITYSIKLREPVLVTAFEGDPNSDVSLPYLPGSALRGAIIAAYRRRPHLADLAGDEEARRFFFDGATRYLNAFPVIERDGHGRRSLPTPLSLHTEKNFKEPVYDFAIRPAPDGEKQWASLPEPFCVLEREEELNDDDEGDPLPPNVYDWVIPHKPQRRLAVHTQRARRAGRAQADDGEVYAYQSLAAGQTFIAHILWEQETETPAGQRRLAEFLTLLNGEIQLGGARSVDYGRAEIVEVTQQDQSPALDLWSEVTTRTSDMLTVTLLSDALLRDESGQLSVNAQVVKAAVENALGLARDSLVYVRDQRNEPQAYLRAVVLGGFNRKWGLPLPQAWAVKMGSVFVFESPTFTKSEVGAQKLRELTWQGLGERRTEGFGRVAINCQVAEGLKRRKPDAMAVPNVVLTDPASLELARRMVKRRFRQRLDELMTAAANRLDPKRMPRNSQLARLRNLIQRELMAAMPNMASVLGFLADVRQRPVARQQYERARIGATSLLDWLKTAVEVNNDAEFKRLLEFGNDPLPVVGSVTATLTPELRAEYLLRFIDAVLARAAKKQREDEDAGEENMHV